MSNYPLDVRGSLTSLARNTSFKLYASTSDMPVPQLPSDLVQAARTQAELAAWLDTIIEKFRSSPEGKKAWRLYTGALVKQVVEELLPIRWYADAFNEGDDSVSFEIVIGNQSYDGIVRGSDGQVVRYLQVTLAFDGYQSRLRMEHMTQYGHAPTTGVVLERDEDGNVPETDPECEDRDKRIAAEFEQVFEAFQKKAVKSYENNTSLIINFRSDGILDDDYIQQLDSFVKDRILPIEHSFQELAFVSGSPGLHLSYENSDT